MQCLLKKLKKEFQAFYQVKNVTTHWEIEQVTPEHFGNNWITCHWRQTPSQCLQQDTLLVWYLTKAADILNQNTFLGMRSPYQRIGLKNSSHLDSWLTEQAGHCTTPKWKILKLFVTTCPSPQEHCETVSLDSLSTAGIKQVSGLNVLALCPKNVDRHLHYNLGKRKRSSVKI